LNYSHAHNFEENKRKTHQKETIAVQDRANTNPNTRRSLMTMTFALSYQLAVLMLLLALSSIEGRLHFHGLSVHPSFVEQLMPRERQRRAMEENLNSLRSHPGEVHVTIPQATMINMETKSVPTVLHTSPQERQWSLSNLDRCRSLWNLTPEQMIQLKHLHEMLADLRDSKYNNPFELVRFIKEFKGNLPVAESKFRAMLKWRETNQVDKILDATKYRPPSLYRYFPAGVLQNVDRDGDPIHCERTGAADSSGLLRRYGRDEMLKEAIWIREIQCHGKWQQDYEYLQGHPVKEFTVILDMQGLKVKNMGPALISLGQQVSRLVQDYYPGYTKRIIVIRAPAIFKRAYNAIKPFIDESMREKITISSDNNHCQILDQYMDLKVLPNDICKVGRGKAVEEFGSVVWQGGTIPDREEELPSIVMVEQKQVNSKLAMPQPQNSTLRPTLLIRNSSSDRTPIPVPMRRKPLRWVRRQLDLFQATFSSSESSDFGQSYVI
jgi:CRAL/TRIO domain